MLATLIILLMCSTHGDTLRIKSIHMSEMPVEQEIESWLMDRTPSCAEKLSDLTTPRDKFLNLAALEPMPIQCTIATPPVPFGSRDVLHTLACTLESEDK